MKKLFMILPLALILCFMVGCQDKEAMAKLEELRAQAGVEEQNKALVRRYFKIADTGDMEAVNALIDEIYSPDYVGYFARKSFCKSIKRKFPSYRYRHRL